MTNLSDIGKVHSKLIHPDHGDEKISEINDWKNKNFGGLVITASPDKQKW